MNSGYDFFWGFAFGLIGAFSFYIIVDDPVRVTDPYIIVEEVNASFNNDTILRYHCKIKGLDLEYTCRYPVKPGDTLYLVTEELWNY